MDRYSSQWDTEWGTEYPEDDSDLELVWGGEYSEESSEVESELESEFSVEISEADRDASNLVPKQWKLRPVRYIDKPYNHDRPSKEQQVLEAKRDREQVRQIASKLHVKLPRELRDEVYKHLIDTYYSEKELKGLHTASDEEYVISDYKAFCPSYVGHDVACEAAEYYYATHVFQVWTETNTPDWCEDHSVEPPGLPRLMRLLVDDVFELGILPYKFIRHLNIEVDVDDICPQMRTIWGEVYDPDEFSRKEISNLEKIHNDLQSMLSLVVDKAKLDIRVQIEPSEPGWYWRGAEKWKGLIPSHADSYRIEYLNVERTVLNVLEAMRKFLYDVKYAGGSVTVLSKIYGDTKRHEIQGLFQTSKEDWEKEKEEHTLRWGRYQPHQNFIKQSELADNRTLRCNDEFANNLPQYRRRWGYEDFQKFMSLPASDGVEEEGSEDEDGVEEGGDEDEGGDSDDGHYNDTYEGSESEDEDGDSDDESGGKQPKHKANHPPLEMYPREMMERIQMMRRLNGPSWGVLPEERA